jgi:ATP-binding cassette subfamily B protein RaxB
VKPADLLELGGGRRTPLIQQSEASECGLACLAMVAHGHGLKVDLPALRRRFSLSLKGSTLKSLIGVAEQIGFNARPLRGEIEHLAQMALPVILHWNLNHFVVLTRVAGALGRRRYHIHDPARGARVLREEELSRHFTGVALELIKSEKFQQRSEQSKLRISQLWSKMSGLGGALRQVLMLSLVLQLIALAMPFYLQLAVDSVVPSFDTDLLLMLAMGFGGLAIINMVTGWLRSLVLVSLRLISLMNGNTFLANLVPATPDEAHYVVTVRGADISAGVSTPRGGVEGSYSGGNQIVFHFRVAN